MKKPLRKWLAMSATSIVPTTPAAASGTSRPEISIVPAPNSTADAATACTWPGRIPIDSNQRAVPASLPPPNQWFQPCASIVAPTITLSTSAATSTGVIRLAPSRNDRDPGFATRAHHEDRDLAAPGDLGLLDHASDPE